MEPTDGLGPLETALHDEHWEVRRAAVRAVAARRDAALVDTIIGALRDGHRNFSLLSSALELLSTTGVDVTDALVSLMGHANPDLRIQAALALGTQHRSEAIDALIAALDDPDVNVRFHAIEALGERATAAAIERLGDIAASGDFFLAFPAIEALVQIGDPLGASRLSALLGDEMLASAAADALGRLGDEDAVQPLVACPRRSARQPWSRLSARWSAFITVTCHSLLALMKSRISSGGPFRRPPGSESWKRCRRPPGNLSSNWSTSSAGFRTRPFPQLSLDCSGARMFATKSSKPSSGAAVQRSICSSTSWHTDDTDAKRAAIIALGRVGDTRATPALVELLGQHDGPASAGRSPALSPASATGARSSRCCRCSGIRRGGSAGRDRRAQLDRPSRR